MLASVQEWHYPTTVDEAIALLEKPYLKPYAGGTMLIKGASSNLRGLISLRHLGLNQIVNGAGGTTLGAQVTFNQVVRQSWCDGRQVLCTALAQAASPSLRNLITLGGSIVARPIWSNLLGALLVLNAQVELAGENKGIYPLTELLAQKRLGSRSLVTQIMLPPTPGTGCYWRFARTAFDYSVVELAAYWELEDERVKTFRLALGNLWPVARRIPEFEQQIVGCQVHSITSPDLDFLKYFKVTNNPDFSAEFRLNLVRQWLPLVIRRMQEGVCKSH